MILVKYIEDICRSIEAHEIRKRRLNHSKIALKQKLQVVHIIPISKQQHQIVDLFWKKYCKIGKIEYDWFDYYHSLRPDDRVEHFIPNNLFYAYIDTYFNDFRACRYYDDKNMYDLYFPDALQPETIIRCMGGRYLDRNYVAISQEEAIQRCTAANNIIIKPALGTEGGKGIEFWQDDGHNTESLIKRISNSNGSFVVQKILKQHEALSKLHSSSINTIRIMTLDWENDVRILSAVIRMGINGSKVDNATAGGIACGINRNGCLKEKAYTAKGVACLKHPQGAVFKDYEIPAFDKCEELVKRLAPRMNRISKMVSWDLAINESGEPVLIEANFSYGSLVLHQMCNGPIFGELTEEILKKVFPKQKSFKW